MADGLLNKKVGFVIQARMGSSRLPGKVLIPIPLSSETPILQRITNILSKSKFNHKIIVATSTNVENNSIEDFCDNENISCFRGSEDDVLSRFIEVNRNYELDYIVRLTADNPIIDLEKLEYAISTHINNQNDYTSTVGLPLGMNFEIISSDVFSLLANKKLDSDEKEHVTLYIKRDESFKRESLNFDINPEISKLRLTIDYESDFLLVSSLIDYFEKRNMPINCSSIESILRKYSWVFKANESNIQKTFK